MKNAVHYDAVTAFGVDGGRRENVQDGGRPGLQFREVGLLLAHNQALEGKLLVLFFDRRFLLFCRLCRRLCYFLWHDIAPYLKSYQKMSIIIGE
jgi:hypothetical protein